jgi:hypothetical protein
MLKFTQNSIKDPWSESSQRRQKGKAKERPKDAQLAGIRKRERKLVPFAVRSYFTHSLSNVTCMQILKWVIVVDEASLRYGVLLGFPSLPLSNLLHTTK